MSGPDTQVGGAEGPDCAWNGYQTPDPDGVLDAAGWARPVHVCLSSGDWAVTPLDAAGDPAGAGWRVCSRHIGEGITILDPEDHAQYRVAWAGED